VTSGTAAEAVQAAPSGEAGRSMAREAAGPGPGSGAAPPAAAQAAAAQAAADAGEARRPGRAAEAQGERWFEAGRPESGIRPVAAEDAPWVQPGKAPEKQVEKAAEVVTVVSVVDAVGFSEGQGSRLSSGALEHLEAQSAGEGQAAEKATEPASAVVADAAAFPDKARGKAGGRSWGDGGSHPGRAVREAAGEAGREGGRSGDAGPGRRCRGGVSRQGAREAGGRSGAMAVQPAALDASPAAQPGRRRESRTGRG
jgi:hypothetical protein